MISLRHSSRLIPIFLCTGILFFMSVVSAYALDIDDCTDLQNIDSNLAGDYQLTQNIDCSGVGNFNIIGSSSAPFTGTFDGQGYTVDGVTISGSSGYEAPFAELSSTGIIQDVGFTNVDIDSTKTSFAYVGGLVAQNFGTIENSYTTGDVDSTGWYVGGLVGSNESTGTIHQSYSSVTVSSNSPRLGGLAGQNYGGEITQCYATGSVTGSSNQVGGLVGLNFGTSPSISNSFSSGDVTGGVSVGGFVGNHDSGTITNSYTRSDTTAGDYGFASGDSTVTSSYWDGDVSNADATSSALGTERTTAQMTDTTDNYVGWDFVDIWGINPSQNGGYPFLRFQSFDPVADLTIVVDDSKSGFVDEALSIPITLTGTPAGNVPVTLDVTSGTLEMSTTTGLTFTGESSGSRLEFEGSLSNVNAALATLTYTRGSTGSDSLEVSLVGAGEVFFSETGNLYEYIAFEGTWEEAKDNAETLVRYGAAGYLATITSAEENDFISDPDRLEAPGWMGASDASVEDDWKWVTGPEAGTSFWSGDASGAVVGDAYANWNTDEPNDFLNGDPGEDCGQLLVGGGASGKWNDLPCTGNDLPGYIAEFGQEGDEVVVESATVSITIAEEPVVIASSSGDRTAPKLLSTTPVNGATGVDPDEPLSLLFDESIYFKTGNVELYEADGTLLERMSIHGSEVEWTQTPVVNIYPSVALKPGESYYVLVDRGAFSDFRGNTFGGIYFNNEWSFTVSGEQVEEELLDEEEEEVNEEVDENTENEDKNYAFWDIISHPYRDAIQSLWQRGVVVGYPHEKGPAFKPDQAINRAEFLKMIMLAAGVELTGSGQTVEGCFNDVAQEWFAEHICRAKARGIVEGYGDGYFRPNDTVNLAEALKIILRTYEVEVESAPADEPWYLPYQNKAQKMGVFDLLKLSSIEAELSRADMSQLILAIEAQLGS